MAAPRVTYEEWLHFPEDELVKTELIDGEVLEMPQANSATRRSSDVSSSPSTITSADPAVARSFHGPPSLVIEVVSSATYDRRKRGRYERFGVPEYWAVFPESEQVQVFRLERGAFAWPQIFEPPATITPLCLPGLAIDVAAIFAA